MIHMPHRSVTRFFVPLIDVLLLLFCMFLLMPIAGEEELQGRRDVGADLADQVYILEQELDQRQQTMLKYENLKNPLQDVEKLQEEVERLRKQVKQGLQKSLIQIIDVDGKTGEISYFDSSLPPDKARLPIADAKAAEQLIKEHQEKAGERDLFYLFLFPRPVTGRPTRKQVREYETWFAKVPNSLQKEAEP